jgi:multiple sugar transport system substrate-binding protein
VCALIGALISLGSSGASASNPRLTSRAATSGLSGNLTLTVFTFSADVMKPIISAFQALNPNLHISYNVVSNGNTYVPMLQTEKLAGTLPDIAETYDVLTPTLEVDGLLTNMSPFLAKGEPYVQSYFNKSFLASYIPPAGAPTGVGNVYALPNEADATTIFYNEAEFKAAKVPFPTNNWTWTQMLADAKKLTAVGRYGICERPDWQAEYNPILKAFGVTAFTEHSSDVDSAAALKAWQLMLGPLEQGTAVPEGQLITEGDNDCTPFFTSGEAAMSIEVRGNLPSVEAGVGKKFAYNVVPMPKVNGVVPTGGGSVGWTVTSGVKDSANALAFLKYLFSAPAQAVAEKTCGVVPAVTSLNGPTALWRKLKCGPANSQAFVIAANTATIAPQTPGRVFTDSNVDIPNAVEAVSEAKTSLSAGFKSLAAQMHAAYQQSGG